MIAFTPFTAKQADGCTASRFTAKRGPGLEFRKGSRVGNVVMTASEWLHTFGVLGLPLEVSVPHGDDADFPRPDFEGPAKWTGNVEPRNAVEGDEWRLS